MRKRFYALLSIFLIINFPTFVVLLTPFYRWGSWYAHIPENPVEDALRIMFEAADLIANTIVIITPLSFILAILLTIELHIHLKHNKESGWRLVAMVAAITAFYVVSILSLITIKFFAMYWH